MTWVIDMGYDMGYFKLQIFDVCTPNFVDSGTGRGRSHAQKQDKMGVLGII